MLNEAVVFPAPLQPPMIYSFFSSTFKVNELYFLCNLVHHLLRVKSGDLLSPSSIFPTFGPLKQSESDA